MSVIIRFPKKGCRECPFFHHQVVADGWEEPMRCALSGWEGDDELKVPKFKVARLGVKPNLCPFKRHKYQEIIVKAEVSE